MRRGRFVGKGGFGLGPGGRCVCPDCGYVVEHARGVPCFTIRCPRCGRAMTRKS